MFIIYCCFKRQVSDIGTYDGGYDIFFNNLVLNGFSIETVTKVPYCGNLGQKRLLLIWLFFVLNEFTTLKTSSFISSVTPICQKYFTPYFKPETTYDVSEISSTLIISLLII